MCPRSQAQARSGVSRARRLSARARRVVATGAPRDYVRRMTQQALFHPAVDAWFRKTFRGADRGRRRARGPRSRRAGTCSIAAPTGSGKTLAAFLAAIDALVRRGHRAARCRTRRSRRLRLAAEGAVERHPAQPRSAAGRHPRRARGARASRRRDPHAGAHRRHAAGRARQHAPPPAAHRRHHAGVALPPARLRVRPRDARDHAHGDRRRDPRARAEQARQPSRAVARAPRRADRERRRVRIGLSATQKPIEEIARFLVGASTRRLEAARSSTPATCASATSRSRCRRRRSKP